MRLLLALTAWSLVAAHCFSSTRSRPRRTFCRSASASCSQESTDSTPAPLDRTRQPCPCVIESKDFRDLSISLARKLSLPLVETSEALMESPTKFTHALSFLPYESGNVLDYALGIQSFESREKTSKRGKAQRPTKSMKPFVVDFCPLPSSLLGKRSSGESGPDLLTKAIAPRKGFEQGAIVYDLMAGMGQDSLLIANAGAKRVHMVERDPIVAALLEDALRRLHVLSEQADDDRQRQLATDLWRCLSLEVKDGREVLAQFMDDSTKERPDIVYLDPMFPARKKSASVKKNMQVLQGLLETRQVAEEERLKEESELLQAAYHATGCRVVVKRPVNAEQLGGSLFSTELKPSYQIKGSVNRWDVYVKSVL